MEKHYELIEKIESLLVELRRELKGKRVKSAKVHDKEKNTHEYSGLTGSIFSLVKDGFFREPRTISDIQKKLRLEGVLKPTTSLMKPLFYLIKKKAIDRSLSVDGKGPFKYHERGVR
ncbi:MAG: hypothetical protein ABSB78_05575 [Bacteroidota bacterium]